MSIRIRDFSLVDTKDVDATEYEYSINGGAFQGPVDFGVSLPLNTGHIQRLDIKIHLSGANVIYTLLDHANNHNTVAGFHTNQPPCSTFQASEQPAVPIAGFTYDDDVSAPTAGSEYEVETPPEPAVTEQMGRQVNISRAVTEMVVRSKRRHADGTFSVVRRTTYSFVRVPGTQSHDVSINTGP